MTTFPRLIIVTIASLIALLFFKPSAGQDATAQNIVTSKAKHKPRILKSRKLALNALNSEGFSEDLLTYMNDFGSSDKIQGWENYPDSKLKIYDMQWRALSHDEIISKLQNTTPSLKIKTYGGIKARFLKAVYGNLAKEGTSSGPILLNRYGLNRPDAKIAGSIIHEAAHRIGLRHDNFNSDKTLGRCEPPYVINQLLEKQIQDDNWSYVPGEQCVWLENL